MAEREKESEAGRLFTLQISEGQSHGKGFHDLIGGLHVLDEAEVRFPFQGMVELTDPESSQSMVVDADAARRDYVYGVEEFRDHYRQMCQQAGIDYVPLDTSMPFDAALMEYLINRQQRA